MEAWFPPRLDRWPGSPSLEPHRSRFPAPHGHQRRDGLV